MPHGHIHKNWFLAQEIDGTHLKTHRKFGDVWVLFLRETHLSTKTQRDEELLKNCTNGHRSKMSWSTVVPNRI